MGVSDGGKPGYARGPCRLDLGCPDAVRAFMRSALCLLATRADLIEVSEGAEGNGMTDR
jgi:hypothetical protein